MPMENEGHVWENEMIRDPEDCVKPAIEFDINNLRQLHAVTTQGEWEPLANISVQCNFKPVCSFYLVHDGNRQFVIAAHNAMPALLDELERLRAENAVLRGMPNE